MTGIPENFQHPKLLDKKFALQAYNYDNSPTTISWQTREVAITPNDFFIPQWYLPSNPSENATDLVENVTRSLLREAHVRAFGSGEDGENRNSRFLTTLMVKYKPFVIGLSREMTLTITIDLADTEKKKEGIIADLKNITAEMRKRFEAELRGLLSDHKFVRGLFDAATLTYVMPKSGYFDDDSKGKPVTTSFEDPSNVLVRHINQMRDISETEEKRRLFIESLDQLLKLYQKEDPDLAGIKLEIIRTEDIMLGYSAIYLPPSKSPDKNATAYISMSNGGMGTPKSLEKVLDDLAMLLAIHKATKIAARGGKKTRNGSVEFDAMVAKIKGGLNTGYAQVAASDERFDLKNILSVNDLAPLDPPNLVEEEDDEDEGSKPMVKKQ